LFQIPIEAGKKEYEKQLIAIGSCLNLLEWPLIALIVIGDNIASVGTATNLL